MLFYQEAEIILMLKLNTDFTDFHRLIYNMIRLYLRLSSPKLTNNPILF